MNMQVTDCNYYGRHKRLKKKHVEHRTMSVLYGMNQDFEEKIIIFAKSSAFWSQVDKENEQQ